MNKKTKRGVYLLPNVLTTLGLFAGFYAVILATKGLFAQAAMAIFAAMLLDALDGRVARLTNTQSEFGAQYDSMADMVSFGIAPALLMYFWLFADFGKIGWIGVFIYVAASALRLARFNAQIQMQDKRYFQGLPSPAAAALIAGLVWTKEMMGASAYDDYLILVGWIILVATGILMVSNIRYSSFKEINLKGRSSFKWLLMAILIMVVIVVWPSTLLFIFFFIYALSGLFGTMIEVRRKRQLKKIGKNP